jgi:hypothetical protein
MKILEIPFHQHLQLRKCDRPSFIFEMDPFPETLNHLQTVHACAQLTLAEASSGEFLRENLSDLQENLIPVIRKTEAKYLKPATRTLRAKASFASNTLSEIRNTLLEKKRMIVPVKVEIEDVEGTITLAVTFDWFITYQTL